MIRNLILTGGIYHPFEETAPALARLLAQHGIESEMEFDLEAGTARLARGGYDLLTAHCLRWTMTQHEKYAPLRAEWAFSLSREGRTAIRDHVDRGKGLLGVHTAPISFDDWPEWGDLLGVRWRWGQSHHPPYGPVMARPCGAHPIGFGSPAFSVADELYSDLEIADGMEVFLEARLASGDAWTPVGFAGERRGARSAYCALGHDVAALEEPAYARVIARAARWTARLPLHESDLIGQEA